MNKKNEELLLRSFRWLKGPLVQLAKETKNFDCRLPATYQVNLEDQLLQAARSSPKDAAAMGQAFQVLLKDGSIWQEMKRAIQEASQHLKKTAASDKRYSLILKLIKDAEQRVPFCACIALAGYFDDQAILFRRLCEPVDLLQYADRVKGEKKARALVRAIREISEWLYDPYLRAIWRLSSLSLGEPLKGEVKDFGPLVAQCFLRASKIRGFASLVDADVALFRNAASHASWVYDKRKDVLHFSDTNNKTGKTKTKELPVTELQLRANSLYQISGATIFSVAQRYLIQSVFLDSGLLDVIAENSPALFSTDKEIRLKTEREISNHFEIVFEPLNKYLATHS